MPQSLAKVLVRLIFSTKNREPLIPPGTRTSLHAYIVGTLGNLNSASLQTGGTLDVHVLFSLHRTHSVADVVEAVKTGSSKWLKEKGVARFAWQAGYGAFSVAESQMHAVIRYIERQPEHHRRLTFQDEFRRFLARYTIAYDERYVWD